MKVTFLNESTMKLSNGITLTDYKDSSGLSADFDNKAADPVDWNMATVQLDYKSSGIGLARLVMWNIGKGKPSYYRFYEPKKELAQAKKDFENVKAAYVSALKKAKGNIDKIESKFAGIAKELGMVDDEVTATAVYNKNHGTDVPYAGHVANMDGTLGPRV